MSVRANHADSLMYLPLADATVITFLAPSIACWACSYLIKEPFTRMEQIAALISLFGVVLIARPTSLFHSDAKANPAAGGDGGLGPRSMNGTTLPTADRFNYDHVTPNQRAMAVGFAMLGVLGAACAFTTIRWIGKRAHPLLSVNYFAAWYAISLYFTSKISLTFVRSPIGAASLVPS
jgi:drug/metabolite transporter (DMT)-like permease